MQSEEFIAYLEHNFEIANFIINISPNLCNVDILLEYNLPFFVM
jgi:hypothetical protein